MLFVLIANLYLSRVVLQVLGVSDFGVYNVVAGFVSIIGFFITTFSNVSQRYISIELGNNDIKRSTIVINQSLISYFIFCLIILFFAETIGLWFINYVLNIPDDRISIANWVFQFSLFSLLISVMQVTFMANIIAREKMNVYAFIGIADVCFRLLICFLLLNVEGKDKLMLYAFLLLCLQILIFITYVLYCFRSFPECRFKLSWDTSLLREMASFSAFNIIGCFSMTAALQGSNIVLNLFWGTVVNAACGIAFSVRSALFQFSDNIFTAIKPQMIMSYTKSDVDYMTLLLEFSSKYSFLLLLLLSAPIFCESELILSIWLVEVPYYANTFVSIVVIDSLFAMLATPLWIMANATGNIKKSQVYGRLINLTIVPLSYIIFSCTSFRNPVLIFFLLVISDILYWIYMLFDIKSQLNINLKSYFKTAIQPMIISLVVVSVVLYLFTLRYSNTIGSFTFEYILTFICVLFIWIISISSREKQFLKQFLTIIKNRLH